MSVFLVIPRYIRACAGDQRSATTNSTTDSLLSPDRQSIKAVEFTLAKACGISRLLYPISRLSASTSSDAQRGYSQPRVHAQQTRSHPPTLVHLRDEATRSVVHTDVWECAVCSGERVREECMTLHFALDCHFVELGSVRED